MRKRKEGKLKKLVVILGIVSLMIGLTACAKDAQSSNDTVDKIAIEETTQSTDSTEQQPETEVVEDTTEEVVEEETIPEEPEVEMVDFETWAKQEGNDEVCLVVWNEELGIQKILPTYQESKETYTIQEGDRFAIPYNELIASIDINEESKSFYGYEYLEISLIKGEVNQVTVIFYNQDGEFQNINYLFE